MKMWMLAAVITALTTGSVVAQDEESPKSLEFSGTAGFAMMRGLSVERGTATGKTGFENGLVAGALLGHDSSQHFGGEVRYLFRSGAAMVDAGGARATLSASQQSLTYDLLWHFRQRGHTVRPFLSGGGGVRWVRGTGTESALQPGSSFVGLTAATETLPVFGGGGGVKIRLSRNTVLRLEARDLISPAPSKVLWAAPGANIQGMAHDIMVLVSIGYRF